MADQFGGIPLNAPKTDQFGGVPVGAAPALAGDGETVDSMQRKFWQASQTGDHATAVAMLRRLKAEGQNTGTPPNMAADAARKTADDDSVATNAVAGWGEGSRKAIRGIVQGANMLNPAYHLSPAVKAQVDGFLPPNQNADEALNHTAGGMTTNIGGQAAPFVAAPEIRSVQGAAALAGAQGFMTDMPEGQNTFANRGLAALVAAPIGAGGYYVTRGAAGTANGALSGAYNTEARATIDAANRLRDLVPMGRMDRVRAALHMPDNRAPLNAGDLGSPNVRQFQDVVAANIPGSGRNAEMVRQQSAVIAGVKNLGQRFPALGEEPETIMQRSALEGQKQAKTEAGRLYDAVDVESRAPGVQGIKTTQAAQTLQQAVKAYPELLSGISNSVTRAKIQSLVTRHPLTMTFANTREVMKAVNGALSEATKRQATGASGSADAVLHLGKLSRALAADQQAWAQQTGGSTLAALQRANGHFAENVAPYRNQSELRNLVKPDANPQGLLRTNADSYETADRLMKAMTPDGQHAYRTGLVQKAIAKGTRDDGQLNLLTLVNALPTGRAAERIFSPGDLQIIQDLARYAKATDRSLSVGNTPLTGKQVAKLLPATAAAPALFSAGGLPAVVGGVSLANLSRRIASSKTLRALLHTEAKQTPRMLAIAQRTQPIPVAAAASFGLPLLAPRRVQDQR